MFHALGARGARIVATAFSTLCFVLPLTATLAPLAARDLAIARPMPPDDPVTKASLLFNPRSIDLPVPEREQELACA